MYEYIYQNKSFHSIALKEPPIEHCGIYIYWDQYEYSNHNLCIRTLTKLSDFGIAAFVTSCSDLNADLQVCTIQVLYHIFITEIF